MGKNDTFGEADIKMSQRMITVNDLGAKHRNFVAELVQKACSYESSIYLQYDNKKLNAKSIMGVMSMKLCPGMHFTVLTEGTDESAALDGMVEFFA